MRSHSMLAQRNAALVAVALVSGLAVGTAAAQQLFVYPLKGQSPDQQQRDRFECHQWAVQQTGFDPTMMAGVPAPVGAAPTSSPLRGAAGGAAIGAIGGAIGGNAARGAAIGAGAGALFGGMRRNNQIRDQQAQQAAVNQQANQQVAAYNRALAACLQGRGYSVQ